MEGFLPFTCARIDILCGLVTTRPVWAYGVELNGRQRYNSQSLQDIRRRVGVRVNGRSTVEVKVKYFEHNIGSVCVLDPSTSEWLDVSHVRPDYAEGLHLHQHRMNVRYAKISHAEEPDYELLLRAKELVKQEIARLRQSASLRERRRYAKVVGESSRNLDNEIEAAGPAAETRSPKASKAKQHPSRGSAKASGVPTESIVACEDFDPAAMTQR